MTRSESMLVKLMVAAWGIDHDRLDVTREYLNLAAKELVDDGFLLAAIDGADPSQRLQETWQRCRAKAAEVVEGLQDKEKQEQGEEP